MPTPTKRDVRRGKKTKSRPNRENLPPSSSELAQRKRAKRMAAEASAQGEFLDDIRVSLEQFRRGELIPADEAHKLLDLELDDDEFERRLHAKISKKSS